MRIVKVRVQEVTLDHHADAAGVKMLIRLKPPQSRDARDQSDEIGSLERIHRLLQDRGEAIHLWADELVLAKGVKAAYPVRRRKRPMDLTRPLLGQEIVDESAGDAPWGQELLTQAIL